MNNKRRKEIEDIVSKLMELQCDIESIRDDERECLDNMPENLQETERYESMEAAADNLDSACDSMDELISYLNDATE